MASLPNGPEREPGDRSQLKRVSRDAPLLVSFAQEAILAHCQTPEDSARGVQVKVCQINGSLDVLTLHDCLNYIASRHEILRTVFHVVNGQFVQFINLEEPIPLSIRELSPGEDANYEVRRIIEEETSLTTDLTRGPLLRFSLLRISEDRHWFFRFCHHLLWDANSTKLFYKELVLLYEARFKGMTPPLPRFEPLQYADYAYWQRQILRRDGSNYREAIAWWKKHLKREPPRLGRWQSQILRGVNSVCRRAISGWKEQCQREPVPVEIPFQRESRLPGIDPTEGLIDWPIDLDQERRFHRLSRRSGASLFVVWLAALVLLLADETGGSEVIVGTYMTSRRRHPALLNMIGCFTSLVALRFQCDFTIPFSEWLFEVRSVIRAAQDRSDIPYDELSKVLDNLGIPPPEVRVIFHQVPRGGEMVHMQFANLELRGLDLSNVRMPRVFRLELRKRICRAHFDAEIYDPVGVQRFLCRLCSLLDAIAQHPQEPIGELAGSIRSAA